MRIAISREEQLLDTGGGLKKAAQFFLRDGAPQDGEPFVLHNVDVLSSIDLGEMVKLHRARHALATLAVQQRESSRYLLFDEQFTLCGRRAGAEMEMVRRAASVQELAFTGIHVISPRVFELLDAGSGSADPEPQPFPIIPQYLRMAAGGETIAAYRADASYWRDLGTPASLQRATEDVAQKLIALPTR
jgi:NDP-sugar pyrophosphorylase family protein